MKIAIIGRALPLVNNPIYIAEEFAMQFDGRENERQRRRRHEVLDAKLAAQAHAPGAPPSSWNRTPA